MLQEQVSLAGAVMTFSGRPTADELPEKAVAAVVAWSSAHADPVRTTKRVVDERGEVARRMELSQVDGGERRPERTRRN